MEDIEIMQEQIAQSLAGAWLIQFVGRRAIGGGDFEWAACIVEVADPNDEALRTAARAGARDQMRSYLNRKGRQAMNEQKDPIEQLIAAKGANVAPRVTLADIDANIASEHYFTAAQGVAGEARDIWVADEHDGLPLGLLTFCVLVLKNGFTVTGESACASPENFKAEVGRKVARQHAVEKIWPLLGFALRNELTGQRPMQTASPEVHGDAAWCARMEAHRLTQEREFQKASLPVEDLGDTSKPRED